MSHGSFDLAALDVASRRASLLSAVGALVTLFVLAFMIYQLFETRELVKAEQESLESAKKTKEQILRDTRRLETGFESLSSEIDELQSIVRILESSPEAPPESSDTLPPRVYFHISVESDRATARALAALLEEQFSDLGLVVPGVQKVNVDISNDQMRFFKQEEEPLARRIATTLEELGTPIMVVPLWEKYGDAPNIRPLHFEIWLARDESGRSPESLERAKAAGLSIINVFETGRPDIPIGAKYDELWLLGTTAAARLGVKTPLGQTVLVDSLVQSGRGGLMGLIDATSKSIGGDPRTGVAEQDWIDRFLLERNKLRYQITGGARTSARVDALQQLAQEDNWDLTGSVTTIISDTICYDLVQGRIAWNYKDARMWDDRNLDRLCGTSQTPAEPARCFAILMHGGTNWGGGTRWESVNAINLCNGTNDADRTISCFKENISSGSPWTEAISQCNVPAQEKFVANANFTVSIRPISTEFEADAQTILSAFNEDFGFTASIFKLDYAPGGAIVWPPTGISKSDTKFATIVFTGSAKTGEKVGEIKETLESILPGYVVRTMVTTEEGVLMTDLNGFYLEDSRHISIALANWPPLPR